MSDEAVMIDTNIVVYAYDTSDRKKNEACKKIVEGAFKGENALAITNQILAETFFVLTRKLKNPLAAEDAESIVNGIIDSINWKKLNYSHETVKKALAASRNQNASIWDSLIAETAIENGIKKIYTENTKDFKRTGLTAINPLA